MGIKQTKEQKRVIMMGLNEGGKTTLLKELNFGEISITSPCQNFYIETVEKEEILINGWDVGGGEKLFPLFQHYFQSAHGIIFVVGGDDRERIDYAKEQFYRIINSPYLQEAIIMVIISKNDLTEAMTVKEVSDHFDLHSILGNRKWYIQSISSFTRNGIDHFLSWLFHSLNIN